MSLVRIYMENEIRYMSWTEFDERRKGTDLVIIPTGSVEAYGPHLPLASDSLAALGIARMTAERTGALIAPPITFGESSSLLGFPGTFTIKKETFQAVLDEIMAQLVEYGFKRFLFITGHGGNVDTVTYLAKQYIRRFNIRCGQVDWWRFASLNDQGIFKEKGAMCHGHASECGTSVLLYLCPEYVHMERAVRCEPKSLSQDAFQDINSFVSLEDKTGKAVIGDALAASVEKGKILTGRCTDRIVEYINKVLS
jgi:creatinine amidohydrolase